MDILTFNLITARFKTLSDRHCGRNSAVQFYSVIFDLIIAEIQILDQFTLRQKFRDAVLQKYRHF